MFLPQKIGNKTKQQGMQENFRGFWIYFFLHCGDGVCISPNLSRVHIKYVRLFAYQLYLSKVV